MGYINEIDSEESEKARLRILEDLSSRKKKKAKPVSIHRKNGLKAAKNHKSKLRKEYRKYLKSDDWAQIKIDLFFSRGKHCELCGSDKKIQVHHLTYENIFNEEPEDLIILCRSCHKKEHA